MSDITTLMMGAAGGQEETDPNFNQTVLLLHGDGTNGAQNNTFLDSSTNNFTITRNGNTTQGTFSPFLLPNGQWSNYANSSSSYLKIADSTAFDLPGDFTVEFWFYPTTLSNNPYIMTLGQSTSGDGFLIYYSNATASLRFYSNGSAVLIGPSLSNNQWYHIAIVRSGGGSNNLTMYVNGVSQVTATNTTSYTGIAGNGVCIGAEYDGTFGGNWWHYLSNLRLVKGTAVYTGAFTPPTAPLTAISGTSLLTCQSNRFVDNSSNNFAITVNGTPSVQPFSPFLPTAEYDASVNGGSGYFDGSDTLSIAQTTATDLGNGNWTLESWVYPTAAFTNNARVFHKTGAGSDNWIVRFNATTGYPYLEIDASSIVTGNAAPPLNSWSHLAVVRNSNTVTIYLNGASVGSATYTGTPSSPSAATYFASNLNTNEFFTGYLANSRFVKGTAVYTSAFTPPTAPLTAIANTSFLLNFTNAGIFDNTGKNNLETSADVQIDTTTKKYGTGSMEFDGNGDYLVRPASNFFAFGTGDFTIEYWAYKSANGVNNYDIVCGSDNDGSATNGWYLEMSNTRGMFFIVNTATALSYSFNPNTSTWTHYALVRSNGTVTFYINGTSAATGTFTTSIPASNRFSVGAGNLTGVGPGLFYFNGFIDDLRITKGVARYTTGFTPPTAAFPDL